MHIETARLVLREFEPDDAHATHVYERDASVVRYQSFGVRSLAESLAYIEQSMALAREVPRRIFDLAVVIRDEQRLVGRCGLKVADADNREGALWYILNRAHWGRGIIREAARALLAFGFGELGLHRIIVDSDPPWSGKSPPGWAVKKSMPHSAATRRVVFYGGLLLLLAGGVFYATAMPGASHVGPLPALSDSMQDVERELAAHVSTLAGEIGERNSVEAET